MMQEFQLLERIKEKIPKNLRSPFGIDDDAACLKLSRDERVLMSTDVLVEGVDFLKSKAVAKLAGRKALAMNLSDIAAMGGVPVACLVSLGIPRGFSTQWIERFCEGYVEMAKKYHVLCVGGDLSRARDFFASNSWRSFVGGKGRNLASVEEVNIISRDVSEEVIRKVAEKLKLGAVMLSNTPLAFINDKVRKIGDKVLINDGADKYECEVVEIRENTVVMKCREAEIRLKLMPVSMIDK